MGERLALAVSLLEGREDGRAVQVMMGDQGWNLRPLEARELLDKLSAVMGRLSICSDSGARCEVRR